MTGRSLGALIATIVSLVVACAAGGVLLLGGIPTTGCVTPQAAGIAAGSPPAGAWPPVGRFDSEQINYAAVIVHIGAQTGVPKRGWIIAVAVAIQESDLRDLPGGPDDSIGLFQQRPSQGWGTPDQLRDPAFAATRFYERLRAVPGWETMPLTDAAQAVQRSAFPDAYATHEPDAAALVTSVSEQVDGSGAPPRHCAAAGQWTQPVHAAIVSGFRTAQRPAHHGVDLGAARGTPIRAAAAGTVTVARCNVVPASHGCDQDGSPQIRGCGWYVDIEHPGDIVTRYCHMLIRPYVNIGQQVTVGQTIGIVGTSGNSSGPHLHFETHLGDHSSQTATDPVQFMDKVCAPLTLNDPQPNCVPADR